MATKAKPSASKGANKRSTRPSSQSGSSSKLKKKSIPSKPSTTQHKPKPTTSSQKKHKPPHLRYTEKQLNLPSLNGIRPAGVQKVPNQKKGKHFVDAESQRTILALVMAEKEGNIESKMMKARQLEEIREARKAEAEKRSEAKKAGLEDRKMEIKGRKKSLRDGAIAAKEDAIHEQAITKKPKKRVGFV